MIIEYYYKYYFLNTFPIFHILIYFDIPQQFFIAGQPGPWTGPVEAGRGDHGDHGRDEARHRARRDFQMNLLTLYELMEDNVSGYL